MTTIDFSVLLFLAIFVVTALASWFSDDVVHVEPHDQRLRHG